MTPRNAPRSRVRQACLNFPTLSVLAFQQDSPVFLDYGSDTVSQSPSTSRRAARSARTSSRASAAPARKSTSSLGPSARRAPAPPQIPVHVPVAAHQSYDQEALLKRIEALERQVKSGGQR